MKFSGLFAGLTTVDIHYFVDSFPVSNKKVKTDAPELFVGGPATNAAVAFAWLNGGASLVSSTGKNSFSGFIENDLIQNKVQHFNLTGSLPVNPVVASVITSRKNGDRNIFTHNPERINPEINADELFLKSRPEIILLDGFYPESVVEFAHKARNQNIPVVLDCGSWKPQYRQLIPFADIVICSADFIPPGCKNEVDVVDFLHDGGVKKSAISRGEKNMIYFYEGKIGEVPVETIKIKDSLGAGDFLHGAFCYYYLHMGHDFVSALKQAAKFATFTCMFDGTRSWINNFNTFVQIAK